MPRPGWYRRCMAASSTVLAHRRAHRVAGAPHTRKVAVRLPAEVLDGIEDRVGAGNVSRYIAETMEDNERRVALREFLDEAAAEHGPVSPEDLQRARRIWDGALEDR